MIIAAHLFPNREEPSYLLTCCLLLAKKYPQHQFIFLTDPQQIRLPSLPSNCRNIAVSPSPRNGLLMHYWYNFKLPSLLKINKVSVFLSESNVCSVRTDLPQCMFLKDLDWMQKKKYPNDYAAYNRRFFSKFVKATDAVLVTEEHLIENLLQKYTVLHGKTSFIGYGIPEEYFLPTEEEHTINLEKIAGGHEYFLCECLPSNMENLVTVLKAFSLFKKRLKSAMKLVVSLKNAPVETAVPDFKNYKYRGDVIFTKESSKEYMAATINNAYVLIYLAGQKTTENLGLFAMKARVPVIAAGNEAAKAIYKEAALYSSIEEQSIADQMMLLYKDEILRKNLQEKAASLASEYSWKTCADKLWQTILDISRD